MKGKVLFALIFIAMGFLIGLLFAEYNTKNPSANKEKVDNTIAEIPTNTATAGKFDPKALTVVSFIQDWVDDEATISLKNNTNQTISSFSATIIYKDMKGNVLDYQEINEKMSIAPRMAKSFKIDAYGHDNYYAYYKSEVSYSRSDRVFKIEFKLNSYK